MVMQTKLHTEVALCFLMVGLGVLDFFLLPLMVIKKKVSLCCYHLYDTLLHKRFGTSIPGGNCSFILVLVIHGSKLFSYYCVLGKSSKQWRYYCHGKWIQLALQGYKLRERKRRK